MTEKRLPSFNDFSPAILKGDLRNCLGAVAVGPNDTAVVKAWENLFFKGVANKRSSTNIPATLRSTGLSTGERPIKLSAAGNAVLAAGSAKEAAQAFCVHLIKEKGAGVLIQALLQLEKRGEKVKKNSLKKALEELGVKGLSTGTTDHTTLKNWMVEAGFVSTDGIVNDTAIKNATGESVVDSDELSLLPLPQQVFLHLLRREHISGTGPFKTSALLSKALEHHSDLFNETQFAKQVRDPLKKAGWIEVSDLPGGPQGGKSGRVVGTAKLTSLPIERFIPDFDAAVPPELRVRLGISLVAIKEDLMGVDKFKGGLALELLALRMVLDLGLDPRHFRLRSAQSAHAEVDLIAEGAHLMFSRWAVQCKRYLNATKVQLSDVAKEVGIAVYSKAQVVMVVTTSSFTSDALAYADEVTASMPLQFVLVPGTVVEQYLTHGSTALLDFVRRNAREVMRKKRGQPLPAKESEGVMS